MEETRRNNPEEEEQITLMEWAELQKGKYPELRLLHHIPNGGKRPKTTAIRMKLAGVKAGVPDLELPVPRGIYHGLYIELKAGKNKTTENQNQWLDELAAQGYKTNVCYGWAEAAEALKQYLSLPCVNMRELLKASVSDKTFQRCIIAEGVEGVETT